MRQYTSSPVSSAQTGTIRSARAQRRVSEESGASSARQLGQAPTVSAAAPKEELAKKGLTWGHDQQREERQEQPARQGVQRSRVARAVWSTDR